MKLRINGDERDFPNAPGHFTVFALVEHLGMKPDRVAVELNREIVPRDRWADTILGEGDRLEVVHFVGGGAPIDLVAGTPLVTNPFIFLCLIHSHSCLEWRKQFAQPLVQ